MKDTCIGRFIRAAALLGVTLALTGCGNRVPPSVTSDPLFVMGTEATVVLPGHDASRMPAALDIAAAVFAETEQLMSLYRSDSDLSAVNRKAGIAPAPVAPVTLSTVALAKQYARLTDGAFDPTVSPLVRLWHDGTGMPSVPEAAALARSMEIVGHQMLRLDTNNVTVFLERRGMALDLGGIAKGTAVDRVAAALTAAGYAAYLVNLGGDMRCAGTPHGRQNWRVGVRDPFNAGRLLGTLAVDRLPAMATSGNYERFIIIDGQRYGHIIDPRSGYPVAGMASVTVMADSAGTADAMATALFVAGIEQAIVLLARIPDVEALLVPDRRPVAIWLTSGMAEWFEPQPAYRHALRVLPPFPKQARVRD